MTQHQYYMVMGMLSYIAANTGKGVPALCFALAGLGYFVVGTFFVK